MVKISRKLSGGYEQFRITLPVQLIRALGWEAGDELKTKLVKDRISLERVT
jgi:bifunctional DNA-binding transcriptional regulator/antitoxin component of YhaV-PrlF toxin-antitoxin module